MGPYSAIHGGCDGPKSPLTAAQVTVQRAEKRAQESAESSGPHEQAQTTLQGFVGAFWVEMNQLQAELLIRAGRTPARLVARSARTSNRTR